MATRVSHARTTRSLAALAASVVVGAVALLVAMSLDVARRPVATTSRMLFVVVGLALIAFTVRLPRRAWVAVTGCLLVACSLWLVTQLRDGVLLPVVAVVIGIGAGVAAVAPRRGGDTRLATGVMSIAAVALVAVTVWTGANSPRATWFGPLVSSGPRSQREVALTFDDGPNATTTLALRDILDAAHVKATFFTVGKALDARPDISAALLADGQLLGNHSFHHDSWRWLDPRYPELARTQRAFADHLGVCPAFYRPPHGQHTPFMAWQIHRAGMRTVTWDVSTADWATTDADLVTRRILAQVRPGSIIDLHDGLDGHVNVDRTVVARALPGILAGLRAKGLQPVRLDVLLGTPGYLPHC
jgi:peptidoglycan/xylan/chitin deacetylase (PgdA/CDA1 family)